MRRALSCHPTRRSSDLERFIRREHRPHRRPSAHGLLRGLARQGRFANRYVRSRDGCERLRRAGATPGARPHATASAIAGSRHRSEEHTSELQSPCNLVCAALSRVTLHDALPISNDSYVASIDRIDGRLRMVCYVVSRDKDGLPLVTYGLETDANAFVEPVLRQVLDRTPLLPPSLVRGIDRKSTRLNSSHLVISYAPRSLVSPYTTLFRSRTIHTSRASTASTAVCAWSATWSRETRTVCHSLRTVSRRMRTPSSSRCYARCSTARHCFRHRWFEA